MPWRRTATRGRPAHRFLGPTVRRSGENAERVWAAIRRFGAPTLNLSKSDLEAVDVVFQIGIPPRRIDLLTSIAGVEFDDAWQARVEIEVEGMTVPVIGRAHLLANKRATGRPKDQADALWLETQE